MLHPGYLTGKSREIPSMAKTQKQADAADPKPFSLIPSEKLLAIFTAMLKSRLLEQRATALFQHGTLAADLHASAGREATAVAAVIDLQAADTLCLASGDWLPAFVKGLTPETLFRVLAPSSLQLNTPAEIDAAQKNILSPSSTTDLSASLLDHASAASSAKNGAVALAFIGCGVDALTQWQKVIQVSAKKKLPVIFVQYVGSADQSPSRPQKPDALVHGVPSIAVDALDPVAVYRVAYEAIVRARQLRGSTLLQCMLPSQPVPGTSKSDRPIVQEVLLDPVESMESYLKSKQIDFENPKSQTLATFNHDLDLATRFLDR